MAPESGTSTFSSDSSSASPSPSTSAAASSGLDGSEKPGPSQPGARGARRHPPVLSMVLEALRAGEQRRGISVAAIKVYILHKYPAVDVLRLKYLLKRALAAGMNRGLLTRPANSKAKGATGSFKLVPKPKRKPPSKKASAKTASRNAGAAQEKAPKGIREAEKDPANPGRAKRGARKLGEGSTAHPKPGTAKEKASKEPSKTKKAPANPGQAKRGPGKPGEQRTAHPKPGTAKEKAPKKGNQVKDQEARLGKARKAPQQPDRASKAPPAGKPRATGGGSQGAQAHNKSEVRRRSSKPAVTKSQNGAASPAKKTSAPIKTTGRGAGVALRAKTAAAPQGAGSRARLEPPARKSAAPRGPGRPGAPTKTPSSRASGRKAEAKS